MFLPMVDLIMPIDFQLLGFACVSGLLFGVLVSSKMPWLMLFALSSGVVTVAALAMIGEWSAYFQDGFTIVHLIYLFGFWVFGMMQWGIVAGLFALVGRAARLCFFKHRSSQ
jgi:hypothetical protein